MYLLLWVHPSDSGSPHPGHMGAHLGSRIHVPVEAFLSLRSSDGWQLPQEKGLPQEVQSGGSI